jgi:hypothetical protein
MRRTALALVLACGATPAHAQDLSSFNQQVQLQIDLSLMLQTQDYARWQMDEMRRSMENSPSRWVQPRNEVIAPADPPAAMTAVPTFWPRPAKFRGNVVVTITSYTPFATIYYTTDGSIPTVQSAQYNGPITVAKTAKVLAMAVAPDHWQSPTAIGAYEIH